MRLALASLAECHAPESPTLPFPSDALKSVLASLFHCLASDSRLAKSFAIAGEAARFTPDASADGLDFRCQSMRAPPDGMSLFSDVPSVA